MKRESVIIYASQWPPLSRLTDEQLGFLFRALFKWMRDEPVETESWEQSLFIAFQFLCLQISIDSEKFLQRCKRNEQLQKWRKEKRNVKAVNNPSHVRVDDDDDGNDDDNDDDNDNENVSAVQNQEAAKQTDKYQSFIDYWNQAIDQTQSRMKKVRILNDARRQAIEVIMSRFPGEQAAVAIYNAMRSQFCNGLTERRNRPVEFDWLMQPENFTRAFEGNL